MQHVVSLLPGRFVAECHSHRHRGRVVCRFPLRAGLARALHAVTADRGEAVHARERHASNVVQRVAVAVELHGRVDSRRRPFSRARLRCELACEQRQECSLVTQRQLDRGGGGVLCVLTLIKDSGMRVRRSFVVVFGR